MTIEKDSSDKSGASSGPTPPPGSRYLAAMAGLIALGAALRLTFLLFPPTVMDSDNALYGIMAKHITEGQLPIFTYGQHYMGALESYVAAVFFKLLGRSIYTLKLSPLLFSLLFLVALWGLAREIYGETAALWALAWAAAGPPALLVWSTTPRGGYSETLFFGTATLWLAMGIIRKEGRGAGRWALLGLIAGVGFWTHFLIAYYLLPAAFVLAWSLGKKVFRGRTLIAAGTFLLGSLPFWIYNIPRGFVSLRMGAVGTGEPDEIMRNFLGTQALGLLQLKGKYFETIPLAAGVWLVAGGVVYLIMTTLALWGGLKASFLFLARRERNPGEGLPLFFLLAVMALLSTSRFGTWRTVRFVLPLYSILPFLAAATVARARGSFALPGRTAVGLLMAANAAFHFFTLSHELQKAEVIEGENREMLRSFEERGVTSVLADYWDAWKYNFLTDEKVVFADPDGERYPPYLRTAERDPDLALLPSWSDVDTSLRSRGVGHRSDIFGRLRLVSGIEPPPERLIPLDRSLWSVEEAASRHWIDGMRNILPGERPPEESGTTATIDLGTVASPGLLRLVIPQERGRLPGRWKVWSSLDGKKWELISKNEAVFHSFVSGPNAYDRGLFFRCEWLLPGRPARFVRLERERSMEKDFSPLQEAYLYEVEPAAGRPELPGAFTRFVEEEGVDQVFADRWESALVVESLGADRAATPGNAFHDAQDRGVVVEAGGRAAFLLPAAELKAVREILEGGVIVKDQPLGDYRAVAAAFPWRGPTGLVWTGFGLLYDGRAGKAYWLTRIARLQREKGRAESARDLYCRSLSVVPGYYLAGKELSELGGDLVAATMPAPCDGSSADYRPGLTMNTTFEEGLSLLGMDAAEERGGLRMTYYWQFAEPPPPGTWVFVHLRGQGVRLQDDYLLGQGISPYLMREGNVVPISRFVEGPELAAGRLELDVGLWQPERRRRLDVLSSNLPVRRKAVTVSISGLPEKEP